jgi:hypothetical protein
VEIVKTGSDLDGNGFEEKSVWSSSLDRFVSSNSIPSLETQQFSSSSMDCDPSLKTVESEYKSSLAEDKAYLQGILSLQLSNAFSAFHPLFSDYFERDEYQKWTVTSEKIEYSRDGIVGAPKEAKQFENWLRSGDFELLAHHKQCCDVLDLIRGSSDDQNLEPHHIASEHMRALNEMQDDQIFSEQLLAGAIVDSGLVCLIGPRNSGKSHLLRRVLEILVRYDEMKGDKMKKMKNFHFPAPVLPIRVIMLQSLQTQDPFDLLLYILEDLRQIVGATDEESDTIAEIQKDVELATKHLGAQAFDVFHRCRLDALREKYSKVLQQTIEVIRKVTLKRQLVIVLEDFDLLAGERQTFLYNLMDIISHGYLHNQNLGGAHLELMEMAFFQRSRFGKSIPDPLSTDCQSDDEAKSALERLSSAINEIHRFVSEETDRLQKDLEDDIKVRATDPNFGFQEFELKTRKIETNKKHLDVLQVLQARIEQLIQRNIDRNSIKSEDEIARQEAQAALAAAMGIFQKSEIFSNSESKSSIFDIITSYNDIIDALEDLFEQAKRDQLNETSNWEKTKERLNHFTRTPITAVMVTSRLDSFSMLEKRVASRFPQRQIIMSGPTNLSEMFVLLFKHLIISEIPLLPDRMMLLQRRHLFRARYQETANKAEREGIQFSEETVFTASEVLDRPLSSQGQANQEDDEEGLGLSEADREELREYANQNSEVHARLLARRNLVLEWNESVMALFRAKPRSTWQLFERMSETTLNIADYFRVFLWAISESPSTLLSPKSLESALKSHLDSSSRIQSGLSCSVVQIMILIEMSRLERQIMFGWEKSGNPFVDVHLPTDAMASNIGSAQLAKNKGKRKLDGSQSFYAEPSVVAARSDRFRLQRYHFERLYYEYRKWITIHHHLKAYKVPKLIFHKEFEKLVEMRFIHFTGNDRYRHSQQPAPQGSLAYAYHHIKLAISSWELDEILSKFPEPLPELILERAKI